MCVFALLGCCAVLLSGLLLTYQVNILFSYWRAKQSTKILGLLVCLSVKDRANTLPWNICNRLQTNIEKHSRRPDLKHTTAEA